MPTSPNIRTSLVPDDESVYVDLEPTPNSQAFSDIQRWLEYIPGVSSVKANEIGSLALHAANPFFPLRDLKNDAQMVVETYYDVSQKTDLAEPSSVSDYSRLPVPTIAYKIGRQLLQGFRAQHFPFRETTENELFIGMNRRMSEKAALASGLVLMNDVPGVYYAEVADKGYNFRIFSKSFLGPYLSRDDLTKSVIDCLSEVASQHLVWW